MLGGSADARFGEVASFGEAGCEGLGEEFGGVEARVDGVSVGGGFDVMMMIVIAVSIRSSTTTARRFLLVLLGRRISTKLRIGIFLIITVTTVG